MFERFAPGTRVEYRYESGWTRRGTVLFADGDRLGVSYDDTEGLGIVTGGPEAGDGSPEAVILLESHDLDVESLREKYGALWNGSSCCEIRA